MQLKRKLYIERGKLKEVRKEQLLNEKGENLTLSLTSKEKELMIFLCQNGLYYEVRIYKSDTQDKYVPSRNDYVLTFEENDEYATFVFSDFLLARQFIDMLPYVHREYDVRPIKNI